MSSFPNGSRIAGFYNLSLDERLDELSKRTDLTAQEISILKGEAGLSTHQADHMVENVIGVHALPLGIGLNFLVNGRDVKTIASKALRAKTALVTQDPILFTDSVKANIWRHKDDPTETEITRVLKAANCQSLVDRLPLGIDTHLTSGGSSLSSGERQLISIARAFARNPEFIILDEATSYIDTRTEAEIQKALASLLSGRTSIVIAHRLSTIRKADRILVLDLGEIVETGTHDQLMTRKGFYFHLNHLQSCIEPDC